MWTQVLERPSASSLEWERTTQNGAMPDDAPELLRQLSTRVGGLDGPISTIVRRALASRLYPAALTRELGLSPVRMNAYIIHGPRAAAIDGRLGHLAMRQDEDAPIPGRACLIANKAHSHMRIACTRCTGARDAALRPTRLR